MKKCKVIRQNCYHISYIFTKDNDITGTGEVDIEYKKITQETITKIRKHICENNNFKNVVIINIYKYE